MPLSLFLCHNRSCVYEIKCLKSHVEFKIPANKNGQDLTSTSFVLVLFNTDIIIVYLNYLQVENRSGSSMWVLEKFERKEKSFSVKSVILNVTRAI